MGSLALLPGCPKSKRASLVELSRSARGAICHSFPSFPTPGVHSGPICAQNTWISNGQDRNFIQIKLKLLKLIG